MNFETRDSFERQLSRLLAFIILFEKQIEELRKKLAGNQEFHSRLVFQKFDLKKKGQVKVEDLVHVLGSSGSSVGPQACKALCRKYTVSGAISYDEMLALISPKTDKSLSQRLMMRTAKRGAILPDYLWKFTCELLNQIISMTILTEQIRRQIQNSFDLNHLEMVEFFKKCLTSQAAIHKFCNLNSDEEYDFSVQNVAFLRNHIRSHNPVHQFTEEDIKEIICPLDMNFQKPVTEMIAYYDTLKQDKIRTMKGFYQHTQMQPEKKNTAVNFLNLTYQKNFSVGQRYKQNRMKQQVKENHYNNLNSNNISQREHFYMLEDPNTNRHAQPEMYLDHFMKAGNISSSSRGGIELDKFISQKYRQNYEHFDDNLPNNSSNNDIGDSHEIDESGSAFVEY